MDVKQQLQLLQREIQDLKQNRFRNLSVDDVETLKRAIFERTATSLASGATTNKYVILTLNGERRAIPTYNKFTP